MTNNFGPANERHFARSQSAADESVAMGRFTGLAARAIQTAMFAAGAAVLGEDFPQMLPGAMQADGEVVFRYAELGGNVRNLFALQINLLQEFAVLLGHRGQQPFETLAEQAFVGSGGCVRKFVRESFQGPAAHIPAPVEINDGAAQDPVEPGYCVLLVHRLSVCRQRLYQTFLHEIFGQMRVADALARESNESLQILQQGIFDVMHGPA